MDLFKAPWFPYKKRSHNKGQLNLATEVLKGFSRGVFNNLCVTHRKSSINGDLEPKSELIIFLFLALKATVVNSDS